MLTSDAQASNEGIVYVLSNPAMPGILKIGRTSRSSVDERMKELYNTSVPFQFVCEYACSAKDCVLLEKALHATFAPQRLNPNREFFRIGLEQILPLLNYLSELHQATNRTDDVEQVLKQHETAADAAARDRYIARRPRMNFYEMGLTDGAILIFTGASSPSSEPIIATVCDAHKVLYNGEATYLTPLTRQLLDLPYGVAPARFWSHNGKSLDDLYNETYTPEE